MFWGQHGATTKSRLKCQKRAGLKKLKYLVLSTSLYKGRLDNAGDKELIVQIQLGQLASIGASRYQDVYHRVTVEYWSRIAEPNVRVGNDSRDPPRTKNKKRKMS
jgi:hypothetical protein